MTVKEFKEIIAKLPDYIDDREVALEYPKDHGNSGLAHLASMEWDESDLILSYYDYNVNYSYYCYDQDTPDND